MLLVCQIYLYSNKKCIKLFKFFISSNKHGINISINEFKFLIFLQIIDLAFLNISTLKSFLHVEKTCGF